MPHRTPDERTAARAARAEDGQRRHRGRRHRRREHRMERRAERRASRALGAA